MKTIIVRVLAASILLVVFTSQSQGQSRSSGRLVVPRGYESYDSVRFSLWIMQQAREAVNLMRNGVWADYNPGTDSLINRYGDSVQATFEGDFVNIGSGAILGGKRKGITTSVWETAEEPRFSSIATLYKARTFYPSPSGPIAFGLGAGVGNYWRYNDVNFNPLARWHNNNYDTNDISPYCEYPLNDSFVQMRYVTAKYGGSDTVYYGNEGRVILGYSDNRAADQLLRVDPDSMVHTGGAKYTAKTFSVNLDFNIDSVVDSALATVPANQLPLMTLQVLFKAGSTVSPPYPGQPVLPFVPFADASHPGNPGWYKVAEVIVNKAMYDTLEYSWKCEDSVQAGGASHSWRFKQLHVMLQDLPSALRDLILADTTADEFGAWWQGGTGAALNTFANPDSVAFLGTGTHAKDSAMLEIRVLSTYRATVRVRGLDYHDTTLDKFLYRRLFAGDTVSHSCNPDGTRGGYDDTIMARLNAPSAHDSIPREFAFYDFSGIQGGAIGSLSVPMISYLDYMGSRKNIYAHWHEQDDGKNSLQFRRFRMIYDGQPPSMFENEAAEFPGRRMPQEYVYYTNLAAPTVPYPNSSDSIAGLVIARKDTASSLPAYRDYEWEAGSLAVWCGNLRQTSRTALWHPNSKRFAIEAGIQGWGANHLVLLSYDSVLHTYHMDPHIGYRNWRITTPEENRAVVFCMLAEGVSSINNAQAIDLPPCDLPPHFLSGKVFNSGGFVGVYGIGMRTRATQDSGYLTHSYNVGHEYTYAPAFQLSGPDTIWHWTNRDTSDISGDMPPFYLGYSNSWRSTVRALSRVNTIYDTTNGRTCPHPYKHLTWEDSYTNCRTVNDHYGNGDSSSKARAFLKIAKTHPVLRWTRGSHNEYIDSAGTDDVDSEARVEVGLFKDSISTSLINRAAILVNTHLYPSLRDAEDLNYYNEGLDSISMCHPVYGDIDVRKVYMTIDTNQLDGSFRSAYYVVRDLWHPDTTWLVKADSQFAVYLKPGDAKFLYFEKAIAITAAPTAYMGYQYDMGLNNGHQIAERMRGSRQVIVHTRARKLYVDLPAKGYTFPGPFEHSSEDNLATGPEITPDLDGDGNHILGVFDTLYTLNPVVAPAQNDTAVAIAYYVTDTVGRIKIAYQPHPDSAWKFLTIRSTEFTKSAHPVLAPLSKTQWLVAASWVRSSTSDSNKIVGFRFTANPGQPLQLDDATPLTLVVKPGTDSLQTPTLASRPNYTLHNPAHLAWMYKNQIYYRQIAFPKNSPFLSTVEWVSEGLVDCANKDPQIVSVSHMDVIIDLNASTFTYYSTEGDLVAWDAGGYSNSRTYVNGVWPVLRATGHSGWSPFYLFRPADQATLHYPQIAGYGSEEYLYSSHGLPNDTIYLFDSDVYRIMLNNEGGQVEVVSLAKNTWTKCQIPESGHNPSTPLRTDSLLTLYDARRGVLNPVSFEGEYIGDVRPVRVTNANLPDIRTKLTAAINFFITAPPLPDSVACPNIKSRLRGGFGAPTAVGASGVLPLLWYPPRLLDSTKDYQLWPNDPPRAELHSYAFPYAAHDTLIVARSLMIDDSASIFAAMHHTGDFVKYRLVLLRSADSSYVLTLDSMIFERDTVIPTMSWRDTLIAPGYVKDSMWLGYRIPNGTSSDTGMLAIELSHSSGLDSLYRTVVVYLSDSVDARGAEKKGKHQQAIQQTPLQLSVHPNPFNPNTQIDIEAVAGLPVRVELLDLLGRLIQPLYDADMPTGPLHLVLEGQHLASGVYFVRATSGGEVVTRRIALVK